MNRSVKYIAATAATLWAIYGLLVFVLNLTKPEFNTPWLALAPALFTVVAAVTFHNIVLNPEVKVPLLLAAKTGKLILSLFVILLYLLLIRVQTVAFLLTFGGYFLLYLILETLIMLRVNKKNKIQHEN